MSGGSFSYKPFVIGEIAEEIQMEIEERRQDFSLKTLDNFKELAKLLRRAEYLTTHADYLLAGDISEEGFNRSFKNEDHKS